MKMDNVNDKHIRTHLYMTFHTSLNPFILNRARQNQGKGKNTKQGKQRHKTTKGQKCSDHGKSKSGRAGVRSRCDQNV